MGEVASLGEPEGVRDHPTRTAVTATFRILGESPDLTAFSACGAYRFLSGNHRLIAM